MGKEPEFILDMKTVYGAVTSTSTADTPTPAETLEEIMSYKETPVHLLRRAGREIASMQVKYFSYPLHPNVVHESRLVVVPSCVNDFSYPVEVHELRLAKEKKLPLIAEFWESVMSSEKRKMTTISERTTLLEEHATTVVKLTSQQDQIIREKFTSHLEAEGRATNTRKSGRRTFKRDDPQEKKGELC
ncbi:9400_t:CDS:2 [Acaulospora colombiana]|uniref:9400_t:CDS:1 n=1 Tax=Acaulospora colombiana TaxID=27376 RepID=A0ACA9K538_9GLOM|nr:9400_t:CDS:2 [Acaulospora colombiana]